MNKSPYNSLHIINTMLRICQKIQNAQDNSAAMLAQIRYVENDTPFSGLSRSELEALAFDVQTDDDAARIALAALINRT